MTMDDRCDFPAAHSMDTTWFAVDRDGHVAAFESGEAGAVPTEAYLDDAHETLEQLAAMPEVEAIAEVRRGEHVEYCLGNLVMLLGDGVRPPEGAVAVTTSHGRGWRVTMHDDRCKAIHARGDCAGCAHGALVDDELIDAGSRGLFVYDHDASNGNGIAGPYRRTSSPARPATAASLPPDVMAHAAHFDGRFVDTASIQPVEHWPSDAWGASFLASDGRTVSAIPGKEDEYATEVAQMGDVAGWTIVRPEELPTARLRATTKRPWWRVLFGGKGGKDD
jgi:hypothetical protein